MSRGMNIKKAAVILLLLPLQLLAQNDFAVIKNNITKNILSGITDAGILKSMLSIQSGQLADGSWKDINYKDESITQWTPGDHLVRLKSLAVATRKEGNFYYENAGLQQQVLNALRYWYQQDPQSKNWWHNEIATPQALGEIMILSEPFLPKTLQDSLVKRMTRGDAFTKTGANKLDIATHYLYRAAITNDAKLMKDAVEQAFEPIRFTTEEGLQYDYSYMQHGPQLQISSYGLVFLSGEYNVASWVAGTAYALSEEKKKLLDTYFTQTFLATIRGRYSDFNTEGRGISRPNILDKYSLAGSKKSNSLITLAKQVNPAKSLFFDTVALRLTQMKNADYGINASHQYFWKGDYSLHLRKNYSFNVRTVSTRTKRTETGNKEDLLGKFLPDGSTNIQRNGGEYYNIMPIWEWDKIPGVTSREFKTDQPITVQWGEEGSTDFVGGVSDGKYGATVYDMNYNDVKAKKSYFFFDDEVVCLGAGINSDASENVTTTLNQSWLNGNVKIGGQNKIVSLKNSGNFAGPSWVWHDSTGYFFPSSAAVNITAQEQRGSWQAINASRSAKEISGDVFKLWIDHGAKPADAGYAYIVVPGIAVKDMSLYNKENIKILSNTKKIQAVKNEKLNMMQIVFYEEGEIKDGGLEVSVDKPCVVLLTNTDSKNMAVYIADPTQKLTEVKLKIESKELKGDIKMNCKLPGGNYAGSTMRVSFNDND